MFGPDTKEIKRSMINTASYLTALSLLLIDKGIFTEDEFHKKLAEATHLMDQEVAKREEEVEKEMVEKFPFMKGVIDAFKKDI